MKLLVLMVLIAFAVLAVQAGPEPAAAPDASPNADPKADPFFFPFFGWGREGGWGWGFGFGR
jgi:hypothetical protein